MSERHLVSGHHENGGRQESEEIVKQEFTSKRKETVVLSLKQLVKKQLNSMRGGVKHKIDILHDDEHAPVPFDLKHRKDDEWYLSDALYPLKWLLWPSHIIHPNDGKRRAFDIGTVILVLYLMWKIPFDVSFDWYQNSTSELGWLSFIDAWFWIDILLNFKTGYIQNGTVTLHPIKIRNHYISGWLFVDLIGTIPWERMFRDTDNIQSRKSLKLVKYFKIPKLLRVSRILKYLRDHRHVYDIFKVFVFVITSLHVGACVWVLIINPCPTLESQVEYEGCKNENVYRVYLESAYVASCLLLNIGEMSTSPEDSLLNNPDYVSPHNAVAMYVGRVVYMIYGLYITSLMIAEMNVYIMGKAQGSSAFQQKIDRVRHEMDYYSVPDALVKQVKAYYDYVWVNQRQYDDNVGLLSDKQMSTDLQRKLALHLFKDVVCHISFFAEVDDTVLGEICLSLKTLVFLPADMILFKGDVGKELFIIAKGVVEVIRDDLPPETRVNANQILLRSGSFFGEIALVMEVRRTCSVQAKTVCEINILLQRTFDDILREHPDFAKRMNELVVARQLETSLSRSQGRGTLKIRQADLDFANQAVEQKMMDGLQRRSSHSSDRSRVPPSSITGHNRATKIVPTDNRIGTTEQHLHPENKLLERVAKLNIEVVPDSDVDEDEDAAFINGTDLVPSDQEVILSDKDVRGSYSPPPSSGGVAVPVGPANASSHVKNRANSMSNIFDDLAFQRAKDRHQNVSGRSSADPSPAVQAAQPPAAQILPTTPKAKGALTPRSKNAAASANSAARRSTEQFVNGHFHEDSDIDLGKVHSSILMGGDSRIADGSMRQEFKLAGPPISQDASPSFEAKTVKQLHSRLSQTEKMLQALMTKMDAVNTTGIEEGEEQEGE